MNHSSERRIKVVMYSSLVNLLSVSLDGATVFSHFSGRLVLKSKLKCKKGQQRADLDF